MRLEFTRLKEIGLAEIIALNSDPLVRRQMPLSGDQFGEEECRDWVAGKERQWEQHGFGPWAFLIDGRFAGWGGFQYENGDADLALVLLPDYWGRGKVVYDEMIRRAWEEMGFQSVTILLPPSRTRIKGVLKMGFQPDGEVTLQGQAFRRYRLHAPRQPVGSMKEQRPLCDVSRRCLAKQAAGPRFARPPSSVTTKKEKR